MSPRLRPYGGPAAAVAVLLAAAALSPRLVATVLAWGLLLSALAGLGLLLWAGLRGPLDSFNRWRNDDAPRSVAPEDRPDWGRF